MTAKKSTPTEKCGIVMSISDFDGCSENHWSEVLTILKRTIKDAGYEPELVSESDEIGVIQKE